MNPFVAELEAMISTWHGIAAPNDQSRRMTADLRVTIADFLAERGKLAFEDEPASFEAALRATMEPRP